MSLLFWDHQGYRSLRNVLRDDDWDTWHATSGEFWDLFLAGCYQYQGPEFYGSRALPLSGASTPVYWSPEKAEELLRDVEERLDGSWRFNGPLELVVVGARRAEDGGDLDWESLRSMKLGAGCLGTATASYTEAHIQLQADLLGGEFPAPGDFTDDMPPREVVVAMAKKIPVLGRLLGSLD